MSSCFFSSRLNIRISAISVCRKRLSTAFPKEPVPPVINSFLFKNIQILNVKKRCLWVQATAGYPQQLAEPARNVTRPILARSIISNNVNKVSTHTLWGLAPTRNPNQYHTLQNDMSANKSTNRLKKMDVKHPVGYPSYPISHYLFKLAIYSNTQRDLRWNVS